MQKGLSTQVVSLSPVARTVTSSEGRICLHLRACRCFLRSSWGAIGGECRRFHIAWASKVGPLILGRLRSWSRWLPGLEEVRTPESFWEAATRGRFLLRSRGRTSSWKGSDGDFSLYRVSQHLRLHSWASEIPRCRRDLTPRLLFHRFFTVMPSTRDLRGPHMSSSFHSPAAALVLFV